MLAFLHTAQVHVETFGRLASEQDASIPIRHEVREDLLAEVMRTEEPSSAARLATTAAVNLETTIRPRT